MEIKILRKNVYGNDLFYPACETAKKFAALTNSKTLNLWALGTIKDLGFKIVQVQKELDL